MPIEELSNPSTNLSTVNQSVIDRSIYSNPRSTAARSAQEFEYALEVFFEDVPEDRRAQRELAGFTARLLNLSISHQSITRSVDQKIN